MTLEQSDRGLDIKKGDIVFIKFKVLENPTSCGDTRLRYYPRNGFDEYAAKSVNAIFIKRPKSTLLKKLVKWFCK